MEQLPAARTRRAALAEQAAAQALQGQNTAAVRGQLRLIWLAEQLCTAPVPRAVDLDAEVGVLCRALCRCARRRPGWLYCMGAAHPLPVAAARGLVQAVLLCFAAGLLGTPGAQGVVRLERAGGGARLFLHGGAARALPGDLVPLLRRLAAVAGGACVVGYCGGFTAAVRLPLAAALPLRAAGTEEELLKDRFSPLYLCLGGQGWLAEVGE